MRPGRLQGWCVDEKTRCLRPLEPKDSTRTDVIDGVSVVGSGRDASLAWTASRNASVASGTHGCGHACTSCNTSNAASTFTVESKNGTALTTPGSPIAVGTYNPEGDEVSAKELTVKLTELVENQPRAVRS
jgi:hypothetical protein